MTDPATTSEPNDRPRRREESSAESRRRIIEAAGGLLAERGVQATTVQAVARRAGISHSSIAWHFGTKDGLVAATVEAAFTSVLERFRELTDNGSAPSVATFVAAHHEATSSPAGQVFARTLPEVIVREGELRDVYVEGYRRIRQFAATYLASATIDGSAHPDVAAFAGAIFASGAGVNLLRAVDPSLSRRRGFAEVATVFGAPRTSGELPDTT